MVDIVYGRGMTELLREMPFYISILKKIAAYRLFKVKQPCCIGSADAKSTRPICEDCGLGCYSILVAQGIRGA